MKEKEDEAVGGTRKGSQEIKEDNDRVRSRRLQREAPSLVVDVHDVPRGSPPGQEALLARVKFLGQRSPPGTINNRCDAFIRGVFEGQRPGVGGASERAVQRLGRGDVLGREQSNATIEAARPPDPASQVLSDEQETSVRPVSSKSPCVIAEAIRTRGAAPSSVEEGAKVTRAWQRKSDGAERHPEFIEEVLGVLRYKAVSLLGSLAPVLRQVRTHLARPAHHVSENNATEPDHAVEWAPQPHAGVQRTGKCLARENAADASTLMYGHRVCPYSPHIAASPRPSLAADTVAYSSASAELSAIVFCVREECLIT